MKDKLYNNADSFAMSFDEEWKNIDCDDLGLKIDQVFELLSDHPFLVSNPENARKLAEFRIFSLKKFNIDPALASSVFVTTITDVIGFLSFLGIGSFFFLN